MPVCRISQTCMSNCWGGGGFAQSVEECGIKDETFATRRNITNKKDIKQTDLLIHVTEIVQTFFGGRGAQIHFGFILIQCYFSHTLKKKDKRLCRLTVLGKENKSLVLKFNLNEGGTAFRWKRLWKHSKLASDDKKIKITSTSCHK